jgi:hypothetical protein
MMARNALPKKDLRDALPKIIGFNIKPGANLLNPGHYDDHIVDYGLLAEEFARKLEQGAEPDDALELARITVLGENPKIAKSDATAFKHIRKYFHIADKSASRAQWLTGIRAWRRCKARRAAVRNLIERYEIEMREKLGL